MFVFKPGFAEREPADFPFVESDIAQLHRLRRNPAAAVVDDATWKDLMIDSYHRLLSTEVSIFGQHALYRRLREGRHGNDPSAIEALMREPASLERQRASCTSLRHATREIATLLYEDDEPPAPWWSGKTWPLMLVLAASVAGAAWSPLSWLVTGLVLYVLIAVQIQYSFRMEAWVQSLKSVQMLLRVTTLLGGPNAARACFDHICNLEADIALARHLLQVPSFSRASSSDGRIDLQETYHPLLENAQALTIALEDKGAFISGQNGIGKSTLLRTLGLNLVAARAFGFCYATHACVPDVPVYASMQSEDSLLGGESLYMAELRRAQELLASASGPHAGIYIIDEIFRGTNHMESVSAAAAVLDVLAAKGSVIVSSHNLVLAPLLAHRLVPLCVAKDHDGHLSVAPGVLAHTNGIALLAERGFGPAVEANASRVFDWLSAYLAEPADCAGVLA